jgi:hypothetical protein
VKIDSAGNYQWDRRFGTTNYEYFKDLKETNNGGYILGGYTDGWSDGDKTQTSWGYTDYWIVKVDSLGNYEWDKRFGGTDYDFFNSLDKTIDGGYILAGASSSGIGGDKTQFTWWDTLSYPYDWWVVKIDSLGNYQWDQRYGGTDKDDEFGNITQEPNGEFLLAGTSYSPISGNKTENNFGQEQIWILEADESGNKLWDKTIFTDGHEEIGGGDQRLVLVQFVDRGIIRRLGADQQLLRQAAHWRGGEDLGEHRGRDLAAAAAAVAELGETDFLGCVHGSILQVRKPAKTSPRSAMKKLRNAGCTSRRGVARLAPFSTLCVPNQGCE